MVTIINTIPPAEIIYTENSNSCQNEIKYLVNERINVAIRIGAITKNLTFTNSRKLSFATKLSRNENNKYSIITRIIENLVVLMEFL
jgi:hypothetical protein